MAFFYSFLFFSSCYCAGLGAGLLCCWVNELVAAEVGLLLGLEWTDLLGAVGLLVARVGSGSDSTSQVGGRWSGRVNPAVIFSIFSIFFFFPFFLFFLSFSQP
ncbi:hypothetical protein V6Z11_D01G153400 [Gossypium hirsutum]